MAALVDKQTSADVLHSEVFPFEEFGCPLPYLHSVSIQQLCFPEAALRSGVCLLARCSGPNCLGRVCLSDVPSTEPGCFW